MTRRSEGLAERRARRAAVDDPAVVLDAALRFLEPRARSVAEVRRRLTSAGYRRDLVDGAIERLLALGMLDDTAFARHWIESRDRAHPRGEIALRRELRQKGVPEDVVSAALDERAVGNRETAQRGLGGECDGGSDDPVAAAADEAAARRLLERRAAALGRVADPRARRQRAYALLARNGFDPETCARIAHEFIGSHAADDPA